MRRHHRVGLPHAFALIAFVCSGCGLLFPFGFGGGTASNPQPVATATPRPATPFGTGQDNCTSLRFVFANANDLTPEIRLQVANTVLERLDYAGFQPARVQSRGATELLVEVYGVDASERLTNQRLQRLIMTRGRLEILDVPDEFSSLLVEGAPVPAGMPRTVIVDGDQIGDVHVATDATGAPALDVELKSEGAEAFDAFAATRLQKPFAMAVDGVLKSAPMINATHFGGKLEITGAFTRDELTDLAAILASGSLPVTLGETQTTVVGPCGQS